MSEPDWKEVDRHEDGDIYTATFEDPDGWYEAFVKWDGCIDLTRYFNTPLSVERGKDRNSDDECYIHICDLDDFIARLQKLRDAAQAAFGEPWPR